MLTKLFRNLDADGTGSRLRRPVFLLSERFAENFGVRQAGVPEQGLPAPAHGYPITYAAGGRQYVAIPAGIGVFRALTAVIFPDIYQPPDGQGLFVFSLPE